MANKRRRNQANWGRYALIHELEGAKPHVAIAKIRRDKTYIIKKVQPLQIVTQDVRRKEISTSVCDQLKKDGFESAYYDERGRNTACLIVRVEEQLCIMKRMLPHYISRDTRERVAEYIKEIETLKPRRPRIPFKCPA